MSGRSSSRATLAIIAASALCSGCSVLAELLEADPSHASMPDAGSNAPSCETWSYTPQTFDPCELPAPSAPLDLSDGAWTFDTNSGALTGPDDNATFPASALIMPSGGVE